MNSVCSVFIVNIFVVKVTVTDKKRAGSSLLLASAVHVLQPELENPTQDEI